MNKRILLLLATMLLLKVVTAQDIQIVPDKAQIQSDTVCAKFGSEFSEKDPYGRRAFAQWILTQVDTKHIELQEPVLLIFQFKVDDSGKVKKVKQVLAQHSELAGMVEKVIEQSPAWKPYTYQGKSKSTQEYFGIAFQPAKNKGESLRAGYYIGPQYTKSGLDGYMMVVDRKFKNADFRFDIKEYIKNDLEFKSTIHIDQEGNLRVQIGKEVDSDLAYQLRKRMEKSEKWLPGLYLTKPVGYSFQVTYMIPAWNEEKEGEKIQDHEKQETSVSKETQRRAAERERQAELEAARSAQGGGGYGGGGGGRIR